MYDQKKILVDSVFYTVFFPGACPRAGSLGLRGYCGDSAIARSQGYLTTLDNSGVKHIHFGGNIFLAQHGVDRKRRRGTIKSTNFAAPSHAARAGDDAGRAGLENPAVFGGDPAEHEYGDQRVRRGLQPAACTEPAGRAAGAANARCPGPAADVARGGWAPPRCRVLWFFFRACARGLTGLDPLSVAFLFPPATRRGVPKVAPVHMWSVDSG